MNSRTVRTPQDIPGALKWAEDALRRGLEGGKEVVLKVARPTRKLVLNALMWVRLTQLAKDGRLRGDKYNKDWWYVIMLQAFKNAGHWTPEYTLGIDGQPVVYGGSSTMGNAKISEFIEFIEAHGVEIGIKWAADPRYEQ
jgi:hypothetical protein